MCEGWGNMSWTTTTFTHEEKAIFDIEKLCKATLKCVKLKVARKNFQLHHMWTWTQQGYVRKEEKLLFFHFSLMHTVNEKSIEIFLINFSSLHSSFNSRWIPDEIFQFTMVKNLFLWNFYTNTFLLFYDQNIRNNIRNARIASEKISDSSLLIQINQHSIWNSRLNLLYMKKNSFLRVFLFFRRKTWE